MDLLSNHSADSFAVSRLCLQKYESDGSFYFNSFCDIDLDTTDALLCGFVQAF